MFSWIWSGFFQTNCLESGLNTQFAFFSFLQLKGSEKDRDMIFVESAAAAPLFPDPSISQLYRGGGCIRLHAWPEGSRRDYAGALGSRVGLLALRAVPAHDEGLRMPAGVDLLRFALFRQITL